MIAHNDCKRRVMILKCEIRNHLILFKTKQKTIWQVFCSEEKKILIPKWIHLNYTVIIFQTSTEKQLRICYFKTRENMSNYKQSKICLLVSVGGLRPFTFNTAFFFLLLQGWDSVELRWFSWWSIVINWCCICCRPRRLIKKLWKQLFCCKEHPHLKLNSVWQRPSRPLICQYTWRQTAETEL